MKGNVALVVIALVVLLIAAFALKGQSEFDKFNQAVGAHGSNGP